jgi:RHS repeat-associated protein
LLRRPRSRSRPKGQRRWVFIYVGAGYDQRINYSARARPAYLGGDEVTSTLGGSPTVTGLRRYAQGGAQVAVRTGAGALVYLLADDQGSASLSVGSGPPASASVKRQRYLPYGGQRGASDQLGLERGWLGQVEDNAAGESGLTYLNARYYNPAVGRFVSTDPLVAPGACGRPVRASGLGWRNGRVARRSGLGVHRPATLLVVPSP